MYHELLCNICLVLSEIRLNQNSSLLQYYRTSFFLILENVHWLHKRVKLLIGINGKQQAIVLNCNIWPIMFWQSLNQVTEYQHPDWGCTYIMYIYIYIHRYLNSASHVIISSSRTCSKVLSSVKAVLHIWIVIGQSWVQDPSNAPVVFLKQETTFIA